MNDLERKKKFILDHDYINTIENLIDTVVVLDNDDEYKNKMLGMHLGFTTLDLLNYLKRNDVVDDVDSLELLNTYLYLNDMDEEVQKYKQDYANVSKDRIKYKLKNNYYTTIKLNELDKKMKESTKKEYTLKEKIKYYNKRKDDLSLTPGQRWYAYNFLRRYGKI